jgi:hypothetical protein
MARERERGKKYHTRCTKKKLQETLQKACIKFDLLPCATRTKTTVALNRPDAVNWGLSVYFLALLTGKSKSTSSPNDKSWSSSSSKKMGFLPAAAGAAALAAATGAATVIVGAGTAGVGAALTAAVAAGAGEPAAPAKIWAKWAGNLCSNRGHCNRGKNKAT